MQLLLHQIEQIISDYRGKLPLAVYLKNYFKSHPKLGSRDRKAMSEAINIYFRCCQFLGENNNPISIISSAIEICNSQNEFLRKIFTGIEKVPIPEKFYTNKYPASLFSDGMDAAQWQQSMLRQPRLFIRILQNRNKVLHNLISNNVDFEIIPTPVLKDCCIALPNSTVVSNLINEKDFVVQDWASQYSLQLAIENSKRNIQNATHEVWDVCSGAGGKSLLLKSMLPNCEILATDLRASILHNYQERMKTAGFHNFITHTLNATDKVQIKNIIGNRKFDMIICDVPCSGSGTWARTPEQFCFFDNDSIDSFSKLQFTIANNAANYLKKDSLFFYITCSVFKKENEAITLQLSTQSGLKLLHQQIINGIERRADSMFVAVFTKE